MMRTYILNLLTLLLFAGAAQAAEPEAGVTRYLATTWQVKPDKEAEWLRLQEEQVVPALQTAGVVSRKVYRTVLGDNTEYLAYEPFPAYATFDAADALEQALGKTGADKLKQQLAACLDGSYSQLEISQNGLYFDPGDAPVLFVSSYRAAQGRSAEYLRFLHEHMRPPIQRAVETGFIEGFQITISDQGGETGIFIMNMFYPDFATLEQGPPAAKMMTDEERTAFFSAGAGLISPLGQTIHEFVPTISF